MAADSALAALGMAVEVDSVQQVVMVMELRLTAASQLQVALVAEGMAQGDSGLVVVAGWVPVKKAKGVAVERDPAISAASSPPPKPSMRT